MALSIKQKAMIKALSENLCNVTKACEIVGIARSMHYQMIDKNGHYKKEVEALNESLIDEAEEILVKRLKESDTALIFFLKTKGKKRGYSEKQEIELSGSVEASLNLDDFYKDFNADES